MSIQKRVHIIGNVSVCLLPRAFERTPSKTRVYGALDALVPELMAEVEKWTTPAVTRHMQEEQPEEAARIMAGYNKARRAASRAGKAQLSALLAEAGVTQSVGKYSVKAGCSCGCSPGFILDGVARVDGLPVDIYVAKV